MKTIYRKAFLFIIGLTVLPVTVYAFQGKAGEKTKTDESKPPVTSKPSVTPKSAPRGTQLSKMPPAPSLMADLTISTGLAGCSVILDGETKGATNNSGGIKLTALKPGEHIVIIRKDGYREEQRNITLYAQRSEALEVSLKVLPTKLSIPAVMEKAETDFHNEKYVDVIVSCLEVLKLEPEHPRANLLLGQSYFLTGKSDSLAYLSKAIILGEALKLPIKHHHSGGVKGILRGKIDELCSGYIVLRKGFFEFHSNDRSGEDFNISVSNIVEIKNEANESGKLFVKVQISNGKKESQEKYNFYSQPTVVNRDKGVAAVSCTSPYCVRMIDTLHKLLLQIKQ
jgi:hypothetical protein